MDNPLTKFSQGSGVICTPSHSASQEQSPGIQHCSSGNHFSPATHSAHPRAKGRHSPSSGGFCSWLLAGKSPLAAALGTLPSKLSFSCSGATLLNCCILSTTSSATRTFGVGEEQVPAGAAGRKGKVVWEQPLGGFTRGGRKHQFYKAVLNTHLELLGGPSLSQAQSCNNHSWGNEEFV